MVKQDKEGQVLARIIIEMLGTPKEHVETTLREYVKSLKDERELKVVNEHIAAPEEYDQMFCAFAELEIWFKNISRLLNFCFEAMPSSVEIIEPMQLQLQAAELSGHLNDLQGRLHTLDMALKKVNAEHDVLKNNADALFRNLITLALKQGPKALSELSEVIGVQEDELESVLKGLLNIDYIKQSNGKYHR